MNTYIITGQIIGIFAAAIMILSFQFKDNKKLFAAQVISTVLFTVHYLFLGLGGNNAAFAGMAQNFGGVILRVVLLISEKHEKWRSPIVLSILCAYSAVMAAVTFDRSNLLCLLPVIGNIICMGAMWTRKPNVIRIFQFTVTTPCWLIFNIFSLSISGIITEVFNLISIGVYYIRILSSKHRRKGQKNEEIENNSDRQL